VLVWVTEPSWRAAVDATRTVRDPDVTLLYVVDERPENLARTMRTGLVGRGYAAHVPDDDRVATAARSAARDLLAEAETRLGTPARRVIRHGRPEREVTSACADADLLIVVRDGEPGRAGPRSLGPATRFVVDHAPCAVLLRWPAAS
jgi:nucleotide-binding universal stress UspA family protein